jgi:hypothetical protein
MSLFNPFSKLRYGNKNQYKRELKVALKCWWGWEVMPHFKRLDRIVLLDGYTLRVYRWETWLSPTIKRLRFNSGYKIKNGKFEVDENYPIKKQEL